MKNKSFNKYSYEEKKQIASSFLMSLYKKKRYSMSNFGKTWFVSENHSRVYGATDYIELANYDDPVLPEYRTKYYIKENNECLERKSEGTKWVFKSKSPEFIRAIYKIDFCKE